MKKIIFGIFAHPDDEAFGPAGTLLQEVKNGSELYLITLTAGDAGTNPDNEADLGTVRLKEWREAGKLLGASKMHFLGYKDGQLNNRDMLAAAEQIADIVSERLKSAPSDTEVEFMGFDLTGLSGHIDHIVATRAACLTFYRLKAADTRLTRIRLYCLTEELHPSHDTSWLYMERGRAPSEIDETVDARQLRDEIIAVMEAHRSQRSDCERYLGLQGDKLGLNHFIVKS